MIKIYILCELFWQRWPQEAFETKAWIQPCSLGQVLWTYARC